MKKKKLLTVFLLFIIIFNTVSCDEIRQFIEPLNSETETETETETDEETEEEQNVSRPSYIDPLTGEPSNTDFSTSRPIAVVVKNDRIASPQYGLSKAGVLYEALVEGGMTRFLAVYSDVSLVDRVGPVIDTRIYFYDFAANHGAAIVQAGVTQKSAIEQRARGITALDAISGEMLPGFFRDEILAQVRGSDTSILTDANGLKARAQQYGVTLSTSKRDSPYSIMNYMLTKEMENGRYCTYLSIPFSANMVVEYTYSTLTNKYSRSQYESQHKDAVTGEVLSFTNIFLIIADYNVIEPAKGEMEITNKGSGTGYYISGGNYEMIRGERSDGKSPIQFYETDGLTPLQISAGNTYIAVLPPRLSGNLKFER